MVSSPTIWAQIQLHPTHGGQELVQEAPKAGQNPEKSSKQGSTGEAHIRAGWHPETLPWPPGITQLWGSSSAALRDVGDGGTGGCMEKALALSPVTRPQEQGGATSASPGSAGDAPQNNILCKEWITTGTAALDMLESPSTRGFGMGFCFPSAAVHKHELESG